MPPAEAMPTGEPPLPVGDEVQIVGKSPWQLAYMRLRRNKIALAFGALFVVIVLFCLAAPLWSHLVADTGPNQNHLTEKINIGGKETFVVAPDGIPIGPGLHSKFLLGADDNGRDVMVRLMYGGRTSIYIGVMAALITTFFAVVIGLISGYYRGWTDSVLSRVLDVIWAFPVLLLGIALGTALSVGGLKIGPLEIAGNSLWIPIIIIGFVYVPYMRGLFAARCWHCGRRSSCRRRSPRARGRSGSCSRSSCRTSSPRSSCSSPSTSPTTCSWRLRCRSWGRG
jgi:peptide/nickel transport system permease protein